MTGSYLRGHSYYSTNQRILRTLPPQRSREHSKSLPSLLCVYGGRGEGNLSPSSDYYIVVGNSLNV